MHASKYQRKKNPPDFTRQYENMDIDEEVDGSGVWPEKVYPFPEIRTERGFASYLWVGSVLHT